PVRLGCKTVVVTAKAACDVCVHARLKSTVTTKINIDRIILKNIFNPSFCIFTRVRHPLYFGSMVLKPASRKPRGLLIIFNVSSLSSPFFFFSQYKIMRYFRRCSSEAKPFKKTYPQPCNFLRRKSKSYLLVTRAYLLVTRAYLLFSY